LIVYCGAKANFIQLSKTIQEKFKGSDYLLKGRQLEYRIFLLPLNFKSFDNQVKHAYFDNA